ncbi:helix-turn-helix domain-containing protein [Mycolicibacterium sp.]|uniref:helix-turn-helix domain-containing protein n=1 Tax=Mycolicibacterium sp. TaxID=2320850 RepID=UPI0037CA3FDF
MRSADEYFEVVKLIAAGLNDCEIARRTGIPRKTVWQWRRMPGVRPRSTTDSSGRCTVHDFATLPAKAYCPGSAQRSSAAKTTASTSSCARTTGRACSPSMGPAGSTIAASLLNLGKRRS